MIDKEKAKKSLKSMRFIDLNRGIQEHLPDETEYELSQRLCCQPELEHDGREEHRFTESFIPVPKSCA